MKRIPYLVIVIILFALIFVGHKIYFRADASSKLMTTELIDGNTFQSVVNIINNHEKNLKSEFRRKRPGEAWDSLHNQKEQELCQQGGTTLECYTKIFNASEIDLDSALKKIISKIGSRIPFERRTPIKVQISNYHKVWIQYRNEKCLLEIELNGISNRAVRGATLSAFYRSCLTKFNYEQINYLKELDFLEPKR